MPHLLKVGGDAPFAELDLRGGEGFPEAAGLALAVVGHARRADDLMFGFTNHGPFRILTGSAGRLPLP